MLEKSLTVGYVSEPKGRAVANAAAAAEAKLPAWNGMFFVYDRRGKELMLAKAVLRLRAAEKEAPVLSQVSIGGVLVLKSEGKSGTSYWAEHGKYAVGAGERAVMEDILGRLDGKVAKAETLAQSAAYQEAQANLGGGLLEFFLRVPDMKELGSDSKTGTFQAGPLLQAARIDPVHSIGGRHIFSGAKTPPHTAALVYAPRGT